MSICLLTINFTLLVKFQYLLAMSLVFNENFLDENRISFLPNTANDMIWSG